MAEESAFAPTKTAARFASHEAELDAVTRAGARLRAWDAAGMVSHTMEARSPGQVRLARTTVVVTGFPGGYGSAVRRSGKGWGDDVAVSPTGNFHNALVLSERDPLTGAWSPVTHYPADKHVTLPPGMTLHMGERQGLMGPELDDAFTCWYNADDLDFGDVEDVMGRASTVSMMLLDSGLTQAQALAPIREALRCWGPAVIEEFCNAGNVAWDAADEYEEMLRSIVSRIAAAVEEGGSNLRRVSEEEYLRMHDAGLLDGRE